MAPPAVSSTDEPLNKALLLWMHTKACLVVLAFGSAWYACAMQLLHHLPTLLATYPWAKLALPMAGIAAEAVFAMVWARKYRLLNAQPLPHHRPLHPTFDARVTLRKFIEEQKATAQWICIRQMLSVWFSCPFEEIWEDNVTDLVTYGFFYLSWEEYEEQYGHDPRLLTHELAAAWGVQFKPGRNPNISFMAHLWQPVRCSYRPLVFYLGIEALFALKHCVMLAMGFKSATCRGFTYYTFRHIGAAQCKHSQCGSQRDVPVLFQHGVGVGLLPYVHFVARIAATGHPVAAMECGHLGMRWVRHAPDAEEVVDALAEMLNRLGWSGVCASGHSYGTFFISRLRQLHPHLVGSMGLIDPVTFNMFTGKLIKAFVYEPQASSFVTWLIARDIHHAASVCRAFYWSQLNLWPEQLPERTLVVLSDEDDLVPVKETVAMLQTGAPHAVVLRHPTHKHAHFIADIPWQDRVVTSLVRMLNAPSTPATAPAQAACQQLQPEECLRGCTEAPGEWVRDNREGSEDGSGTAQPAAKCGVAGIVGPQQQQQQQASMADAAGAGASERWHPGRLRRRRSLGHVLGAELPPTPPSAAATVAAATAAAVAAGVKGVGVQLTAPVHQHSDSASSYEGMRLRARPHRLS